MIAACGIDCEPCPIRRMIFDDDAAKEVIAWFHERGFLKSEEGLDEAIKRNMYCCGCFGDRDRHWSPDCEILNCCVDTKHLNNCSECDEFPCNRLTDRAQNNARYDEALERLKSLR